MGPWPALVSFTLLSLLNRCEWEYTVHGSVCLVQSARCSHQALCGGTRMAPKRQKGICCSPHLLRWHSSVHVAFGVLAWPGQNLFLADLILALFPALLGMMHRPFQPAQGPTHIIEALPSQMTSAVCVVYSLKKMNALSNNSLAFLFSAQPIKWHLLLSLFFVITSHTYFRVWNLMIEICPGLASAYCIR